MSVLSIRDLKKSFRMSTSGIGSLKTALLWWQRRKIQELEVLRGVDLEINAGECVALVGRNGAGKSTLLSLVARVYKASSGTIAIEGRIAPLLELGAGFHPDLTGAENILFNGIILGLTRKQVRDRIEKIVEFSELGDHIYAPVRAYSSGMMARLGFAIAIHVDADILIVDEVLAVGDFEFEQKCYRAIDTFREQGGTILFVSHNVDSIRRVASRCVWLTAGQIKMDGAVDEVLTAYLHSSE